MLFLLIGCGKDGSDGKAFISFFWSTCPEYYSDDNSSTPSTIYIFIYYQSPSGTYHFEYAIYDNDDWLWFYTGTYKLTINEGEPGGFLTNGADGDDKYFDMYLGVNGPSLTGGKYSNPQSDSISFINDKHELSFDLIKYKSNIESYEIEITQGRYNLQIQYQRIKLSEK